MAACTWLTYDLFWTGGDARFKVEGRQIKRPFDVSMALVHGIGMMLMLIAGFGAMARLGYMSGAWPWWIYVKLVIWLALGGSLTFVKRKPNWGVKLIVGWLIVAGIGAYLGIFKPSF